MGITTLSVPLPSYFYKFWTVAQTQILQINILPITSSDCQNQISWLHASVIISLIPADAEVLTLAHITLTCIYAILWMLSCNSSTELREIKEIFYFCFTVSLVYLSLSPRHGVSSLSGWRNCLQTWRVAGNVLNIECGQKSNGGPTALCLGELLKDFHFKCYNVTKYFKLFCCGHFWMR